MVEFVFIVSWRTRLFSIGNLGTNNQTASSLGLDLTRQMKLGRSGSQMTLFFAICSSFR
jgi:hypothetical protein